MKDVDLCKYPLLRLNLQSLTICNQHLLSIVDMYGRYGMYWFVLYILNFNANTLSIIDLDEGRPAFNTIRSYYFLFPIL